MNDPPDAAPAPALEAEFAEVIAQKDVLLQEIGHRVKNNLQLVASLILLQSRRATDENARAALKSV
ncbi:MAG: histidine kinase dimerization/phosphoacceptor domain -containing protein, partial [Phenylobacterium sp.]